LIKLEKNSAPSYLDASKVSELTKEFKDSGKNVWNHDAIKKSLLESSNKKCAYCECNINVESNYLEVEHFEDKSSTPNKVVEWDNLLPSCKRCNGAKGTHDVISDPIINPFKIDPKEHLKFKLYRLVEKTAIGKNTIDALNLNHSERAVFKRFEIGEQVISAVNTSWDRYNHWSTSGKSTRSKNILIGGLEGLLLECQREASYSATSSTVLHSDSKYIELVAVLKSEGLWSDDLEILHVNSAKLTLECA